MKQFIYKSGYPALLFFILIAGCSRDDGEIQPKPIPRKLCPTLYNSIMNQFPEFENNETTQAVLFDTNVQKRIYITKETDIYVSFVSEGAGFSNTFGWYAYDSANA